VWQLLAAVLNVIDDRPAMLSATLAGACSLVEQSGPRTGRPGSLH
jgi:hypothetical protein